MSNPVEIQVLNNDDVRNLPVGHYRVVRGNATVEVLELERQHGRGKTSKQLLVLLDFPCTLTPADDPSDE